MNDLRLAFRQLLKAPGFTAVTILTLSLGIGATTALFSIVNAVLLRPLDFPHSAELVHVFSRNLERGHIHQVSAPDFADWQAGAQSFASLARYHSGETAVGAAGAAESLTTAHVSEAFFRVLGVPLLAGRHFDETEHRTGGVAVVGEAFARRHFPDPAGALGRTISLYGRTFTITGVMPADFAFPERAEVWLPIDTVFGPSASRTAHNFRTIARLKPDMTLPRAQAEMDQLAGRIRAAYPQENANKGVAVVSLHDHTVRHHRDTLWILFGSVVLLLLLACANVANLLLARGLLRTREVAVRAALGASMMRIIRSLLGEAVLLALAATFTGTLLGWGAVQLIVALAPTGIPRLETAAIDGSTLLFSCSVAGLVCVIAGLLPAWRTARPDLKLAFRTSGPAGSPDGAGQRLRNSLVVAQLAISLLLLSGAGLFARSLHLLEGVDPGYRPAGLLVMTASFPVSNPAHAPKAAAFYTNLLRESRSLPGARAATYAGHLPIDNTGGTSSNGTYFLEERPELPASEWDRYSALWRVVGPDFFETLGIPILQGRGIAEQDGREALPVVVVSESLARTAWPGQDPIGRRLKLGWMHSTYEQYLTVVGVCADVKQGSLDATARQELYIAGPQHPLALSRLKLIVRTEGEPAMLGEPLRRLANRLDAGVPVQFTTAPLLIEGTKAGPRFRTLLAGLFAGVALILAVVGVAGVLACMVAERRTEIGIRMALGARPASVVAGFLAQGFRLALVGLLVGLTAALAAGRLLRSLLFGISPDDPLVFLGVGLILLISALLASAIPAVRAAKVDPMAVLRGD